MPTKRVVPLAKKAAKKTAAKLAKTSKPAKPSGGHPIKPEDPLCQRVRTLCLALPDTFEKLSHGEPTFFTANRVFAQCSNNHHWDGHVGVWIPAADGEQAELIKQNAKTYYRPPYVGPSGWVGIELSEIDDEELAIHLHDAWRLIQAKKPAPRRRGS